MTLENNFRNKKQGIFRMHLIFSQLIIVQIWKVIKNAALYVKITLKCTDSIGNILKTLKFSNSVEDKLKTFQISQIEIYSTNHHTPIFKNYISEPFSKTKNDKQGLNLNKGSRILYLKT